jgi:soluble lytic murein transglycosylase-like protein
MGAWRLRAQSLFLCLLLAATVFTVNRQFHDALFHNAWIAHHPLPKFLRFTPPVPLAPSAFEQEADMSASELLDRWNPLVADAAKRVGVPVSWIRAVMNRESGGRTMMAEDTPIASNAGALGLMQLEPETYAEMAAQYGLGADPFNARDNIVAGAAYLRWLKSKYGFPGMFAAYNFGPGNYEAALAKGKHMPAETVAYLAAMKRQLRNG